jgi:hypothetical protein
MDWRIVTARTLSRGRVVNTIYSPDTLIVHYAGKSCQRAKAGIFNPLTTQEVIELFGKGNVNYIGIHH